MLVTDLLSADKVQVDWRASSKKRLLEMLSDLLADGGDNPPARAVFESLCARERLGSTGLGQGVAIPHGRVEDAEGVRAAFVRLQKPVGFDAADQEPVDLVFALAVPANYTDEHLKLLAQIAELFSDEALCRKLRDAATHTELHRLLATAQS